MYAETMERMKESIGLRILQLRKEKGIAKEVRSPEALVESMNNEPPLPRLGPHDCPHNAGCLTSRGRRQVPQCEKRNNRWEWTLPYRP